MRIESLHIEGFGHFTDRTFGPLTAPITIFYGPNEAGKTMLMNFLRTMLLGFPAKNRRKHYLPQSSGSHGGRLDLCMDAGEFFRLRRSQSGSQFSLSSADGSESADREMPSSLLGHASKQMYEAVFAFSLTELQHLDSLNKAEVNSQIYSAGMGAFALPAALAQLQSRRDDTFKAGGWKQTVWKLHDEVEQISARLAVAADESGRFSELKQLSESAAAESVRLRGELDRLASGRQEFQSLRQAWDDWQLRNRIRSQVDAIPCFEDFPREALVRLEKQEERVGTAEAELAKAENELQQAGDAILPTNGEGRLLLHKDKIALLLTEQGRFEASVEDLAECEEDLIQRRGALQEALAGLGPGWDEERVFRADQFEPLRAKASSWASRLDSLHEASLEARVASDRADANHEEALQECQELQQSESDLPLATLEDRLEEKQRQLLRCKQLRDEWLRARIQREAAGAIASTSRPERRTHLAIPALFLSTVVAATGLAVGGPAAVIGLVAALAIFALGLVVAFHRGIEADAGNPNRTVEVDLEVARLEAMLVEALRALGATDLDLEVLDRVEFELLTEAELVQSKSIAESRLNDARAREARLAIAKAAAAEAKVDCLQSFEQARTEWQEWIRGQKLSSELSPPEVILLLAKVEAARERSHRLAESLKRFGGVRAEIEAYSKPVARLGVELDLIVDADNASSVATAASTLIERFESATKRHEARERAQAALVLVEGRVAERRESLNRASAEIGALLLQGGAATVEEFRQNAAAQERRTALGHQRDECESRLDKLSESVGGRQALEASLEAHEPISLEAQVLRLEDEAAELDRQRLESVRRQEAASAELRRLTSEEESSALRAQRESLRANLAAAAREWSVSTLALEIMEKAQSKYERERQPTVVRNADSFFTTITGGRYRNLRAPIGAKTLTVEDSNGAQKELNQLSRGTQEALYLALRLGLIRQFGEGACNLPVIVDEALVNFDPDRALRAAQAFSELSRTNQVLVFTCHPAMRDLFCDASPEAQMIQLSSD